MTNPRLYILAAAILFSASSFGATVVVGTCRPNHHNWKDSEGFIAKTATLPSRCPAIPMNFVV